MTLDTAAHQWLTTAASASVRGGLALCLAWGVSLVPRVPAAVRCWAWRAAYAVLLASFAWTTPVGLPVLRPIPVASFVAVPVVVDPPAEPRVYTRGFVVPDELEPAVTVKPEPFPTRPIWPPVLFVAWLVYVAAFAVRLCVGWRTAARLRTAGEPADPAVIQPACAAAGVRRPPAVRVGGVRGPLLVGLLRPVILLPAGLPPSAVDLVLAHELAHLRRRDLWWNWLPTGAAALLPWHPLVWICNRRWRLAAEAACDADAIAATAADPADYGRALLSVVTGPRGPAPVTLAVGAAESRWALTRRLVAMTTITHWNRRRRWAAATIVALAGVAAAVPWRAVARDGPATTGAATATAAASPVSTKRPSASRVAAPIDRPPAAAAASSVWEGLGTVVPQTAKLRATTTGELVWSVTPGSGFASESPLFELAPTERMAAARAARSKMNEAAAKLVSAREQMVRDRMQTEDVTKAELLNVNRLQKELLKTIDVSASRARDAVPVKLRAPSAGIMLQCYHQSGDVVTPSDDLGEVELSSQDRYHPQPGERLMVSRCLLRADLPPSAECKAGAKLAIRRQSGEVLPQTWAVVTGVGPFDQNTPMVVLQGRVEGDASALQAGEGVYVHLVAGPSTRP